MLPPEVYPVPETSLVVEKAVVEADKVALLVNKASLNVLPVPVVVVVPPRDRDWETP